MKFKIKKRNLLPVMCLATSLFTLSCSSELDDNSGQTIVPEEMLTITVTAGTTDDSTATRAVITDKSGSTSPWTWEKNDKLQLITTNPSTKKKVVTQLTLVNSQVGKEKGVFTGTIPKNHVTSGAYYRFYYTGDRIISQDEAKDGKIEINLSQQTGKLEDLKKYCVLSGTGKVIISGDKAELEGSIKLKNAFAVAHFAMKTNDGTQINRVGIRGSRVYCVASVNLEKGNATGIVESDTKEANIDGSIMISQGVTDFYVTLVPATVSPTFDAYYSGSFNTIVSTEPVKKDYPEEESFVYYKGSKAAFSVSNNKKVAITNGNMQYVMPITTYTSATMKPKELKPNQFIRWAASKAIKVTGNYKKYAGFYRLAPEQWEMAMPRNGKTGGSYTYSTVMYNGKEYISPETYRYFDLPSWGTMNAPTLVNFKYTGPTYPETYTETQFDYGQKLNVGNKNTRVLTVAEWEYLFSNGRYKNSNREWADGTPKWAKCFIDENGDKIRSNANPAELRGYLIFPDNMTKEEAKEVFTKNEDKFGNQSNSLLNATTYEKIKNSGAVFLPLTAYRNPGQKILSEWGQHGNYSTSTYQNKRLLAGNKGMYHVRFTISGIVFTDDTEPGQGCASRLVQDLNN